jgi:DNA mismatch repair protein MutL
MSEGHPASRRIRILRDDVSRKIAAGEVIDRPFSIVRELLDNSIDAGATSIDVYIEGGGLGRVRVVDDGAGMDAEDLALCGKPHATSKIETENDLLTVTSLGFRGEALSSMAVAARLEIVSAASGQDTARRLIVRGGAAAGVEACEGRKGTAVDVSELFFNFPARKKFLKSASAESALCRGIFNDRAVAYPGIGFRFFSDGTLRLFLPPAGEAERITAVYSDADARLLSTGKSGGNGFTVRVVGAEPTLRRRDRKLLQVFINGRRVSEFSLMQAAEYGYSGFIPGGWHPIAFVFVQIDPAFVDFNIHPAKKEVRLRNPGEVHEAVVRATREALGSMAEGVRSGSQRGAPAGARLVEIITEAQPPLSEPDSRQDFLENLMHGAPTIEAGRPAQASWIPARFLGQVFGVFLVFAMEDRILFLDQHAAHERLIFEKLSRGSPRMQELLVPLYFDASANEGALLSDRTAELLTIGIGLKRSGRLSYEITALSAEFERIPEAALIEMLKTMARGEGWVRELRARAACRLALKEGNAVDMVTAQELLRGALALDPPRCPHGRPIWHEVSRDELYKLVDRPVQ